MQNVLRLLPLCFFLVLGALGQQSTSPVTPESTNDPFLWLEDSDSSRTWEWRLAQSEKTRLAFENSPTIKDDTSFAEGIYFQDSPIPKLEKIGEHYYGFWYDNAFRNGALRRTTKAELTKPEPDWEIVFDGDRGSRFHPLAVGFQFMQCLKPSFERCLFFFSPTNSDSTVAFEYDLKQQRFVAGGFALPEARGSAHWLDTNTLLISRTDAGLVSESGYALAVRQWTRGTPLSSAKTVLAGTVGDLGIWVSGSATQPIASLSLNFFQNLYYLRRGEDWQRLEVPPHASVDVNRQNLLVYVHQNWAVGGQRFVGGSLLQISLESFLQGSREFAVLYEPAEKRILSDWAIGENQVALHFLDNVRSRIEVKKSDGTQQVLNLPIQGSYTISSASQTAGDEFFVVAQNHLTPQTWFLVSSKGEVQQLRQRKTQFDASNLQELRFNATSKDGTSIPYTVIAAKNITLDGKNPTLLYGYGGFNLSLSPFYSATIGKLWLERGGVFVVANIRGGGEYGAAWHEAATGEYRQNSFDDFIAVAEDLIERKFTSPKHLGIRGESNGGLLVGAVMLQRPELFNAVVCVVPLLDMRRYTKLLVGSSWIAEYGNPDIATEWAYIGRYSPYHNVLAQKKYPKLLLLSASTDDRVHPAHARKMAALMQSLGHEVLYHETYSGGHGSSGYQSALSFNFLWQQLK
jgi:prolyl oligopeptidase